ALTCLDAFPTRRSSDLMDHGAGQAIAADSGDAGAGVDAGLLQEPDVQCHVANVGRGDAVDKRRRGLSQYGRPEPDPETHRAHQEIRRAHVCTPLTDPTP